MSDEEKKPLDFIRAVVSADVAAGKHGGRVVTRFPPEPNGHLHIGHAKAISIDFGVAAEYGGVCHLRFDDTNPIKEEAEYAEEMKRNIRWLGYDWGEHLYHASDYFDQLYEWAEELIGKGLAYVDDQSADRIRETRGTLTEPGTESPFRDRTVEENLDLFRRMKAGEFGNGAKVLRAKIDMAHPNMNMRDPVMYRIQHTPHHRTGDLWCIYPMYDWAHGQSDSIEGITHSLCSLEFENHRPLYDWFIANLDGVHVPRQYEFARMNVTYTITSKRALIGYVERGDVRGWDDPRMPTLSGLRRRGFTPESIRAFCERAGVAKVEGTSEIELLEHCLREDLNRRATRAMAVLDPVRLVIENYPEDGEEEFDFVNNPEDESAGTRKVPFSRVVYVERDDFREDPPRKFHRLGPGREVRLRYAYLVTCTGFETDENGEVTEIRATYDPESRGGNAPDGRKVRGTIHWVSAKHAVPGEVRLYDRLFTEPHPTPETPLNPESLVVLESCMLEPSLAGAEPGTRFQFERKGYFVMDPDSEPGAPVYNRTVPLRDSWKKIEKKAGGKP